MREQEKTGKYTTGKWVVYDNVAPKHYLIVVFYKDFTSEDICVWGDKSLDNKLKELCANDRLHDFVVFKKVEVEYESK